MGLIKTFSIQPSFSHEERFCSKNISDSGSAEGGTLEFRVAGILFVWTAGAKTFISFYCSLRVMPHVSRIKPLNINLWDIYPLSVCATYLMPSCLCCNYNYNWTTHSNASCLHSVWLLHHCQRCAFIDSQCKQPFGLFFPDHTLLV